MLQYFKKTQTKIALIDEKLYRLKSEALSLKKNLKKAGNISGGGTFEWVDSQLVKVNCEIFDCYLFLDCGEDLFLFFNFG